MTTIAVAIVERAITIWEAKKEAMNQSTKLIQKIKQRGKEHQFLKLNWNNYYLAIEIEKEQKKYVSFFIG